MSTLRWIAAGTAMLALWLVTMWRLEPELAANLGAGATRALQGGPEAGWATLSLRGRDIVVKGTAPDAAARAEILDRLRQVRGVRHVDDLARPRLGEAPTGQAGSPHASDPVASGEPFAWRAMRFGNEVRLIGHVPSARVRHALIERVAGVMPGTIISDRLDEHAGAPEGFEAIAATALGQLARLESGTVQVIAGAYAVQGVAGSRAALDELQAELRSLPGSFRAGAVEISVAEEQRHVWIGERNGLEVTLTGSIGSEDGRRSILAAAAAAIPDARILDQQHVDASLPDGTLAAARHALHILSRLSYGTVRITDNGVGVSGRIADPRWAEQLKADAQSWPAGYQLAEINLLDASRRPAPSVAEAARPDAVEAAVPVSAAECTEAAAARLQGVQVEFEPRKVVLGGDGRATIDRVAAEMRQCAKVRLVIAGHGDSGNGEKKEAELARRRADVVAEALRGSGIERDRLIIAGPNAAYAPASGSRVQRKAAIRKVELMVVR